MTLENPLIKNKATILNRWLDLIMETYPADTLKFIKREKDRFANPVGYTVSQEIKVLYEELLHDMDADRLKVSLDSIIRIRSVQDFPPSQALSFVFLLKKAIKEELASELGKKLTYKELALFEARIDKLALLALDIYVKCREKIHEIRINEVKAEGERAFKLLEITNLVYGKPDTEQPNEDREDTLP